MYFATISGVNHHWQDSQGRRRHQEFELGAGFSGKGLESNKVRKSGAELVTIWPEGVP